MSAPSPDPRKVPASQGWAWIGAAFAMVRRWPSVFPLMGLCMGLITWVPLFGVAILLLCGPGLLAGCVIAARSAATGGKPEVRQLWSMFEQPARRSEAFKLCIPLVAGKLAAIIVVAIGLDRYLVGHGMKPTVIEHDPQKLVEIFAHGDMLIWLGVAVLLVLVAWTFTALAIPKVALENKPAFVAMGESARQIWSNLGAWLVAFVGLFMVMMVVAWLLLLTRIPALMQLGTYTAMNMLLGPVLYTAWHELGGETPPAGPSRPASSPPPPTDVLEA